MRFGDGLGIKAVSMWLPDTYETVADQVSIGHLTQEDAERLGVTHLPAAELAPPQMAVLAARKALRRAGWNPGDIGVIAHAWLNHQGRDKWSVAHYLANELHLPSSVVPIGLHELCNGGTTALRVAATMLVADPAVCGALVTTADRFMPPTWDRWHTHSDMGYGDGATAVLLHRRDGSRDDLILHSLTQSTASWLEGMERGDSPFTTFPMENRKTLATTDSRKAFYAKHGKETLGLEAHENVRVSLRQALAEAGLEADDPRIRLMTVPRLGPRLIDMMWIQALQGELKAEVVLLGGRTGHLGAGDMAANLADLVDQDLLEPGEFAIVAGGGGGFTWCTAIVQAPER